MLRVLMIAAVALGCFAGGLAGCSGGGSDSGVTVGTTGGGATSGDAGTIGDAVSDTTAGATDVNGSSGGGGDSSASGGGTDSASAGSDGGGSKDGGGSSGGSVDGGGSSGGADTANTPDSSTAGADSSSSSSSGGGWPAGPEDKLTGVDAAKAKYTTCSKAWSCAVTACQFAPTKGCMDVCLNAASKPVVSEMLDYVKCFNHICHDKACKSGDKKCISDCLWSRCSGFAMKCNADNKSGGLSCGTAFGCFDTCKGADTIACLTKCYVDLGKPAQSDFVDLWFCIAKSDAKEPFADCMMQALTCSSGGTTGKNTCLEISQCDSACEKDAKGDKFPCTSTCFGAGTATAQAQFGGLMTCVVQAQSSGVDPGPACGKSVAACAGSKPDGTKGALGCQDIAGCEDTCKKASGKDDSCAMQCLGKATVTEAVKWWEQAMCWGACGKSCEGNPSATCVQTCFVKDCKKQSQACLGL